MRYHPIHKLECIDARKHASYWGMFSDKKKSAEGEAAVDDTVVLLARRSSKRGECFFFYRKLNALYLLSSLVRICIMITLNSYLNMPSSIS